MDTLTHTLTTLHLGPSTHDPSNPNQIYTPLPSPNHFRILSLSPGYPSDPIRAQLFLASLTSAPAYSAISYVWGDPSLPTRQITVNGVPFSVTPSLFWALSRVRLPDAERLVWADAVCINQEDILERGAEVTIMGQIYALASRVLVSLGPVTSSSSSSSSPSQSPNLSSLSLFSAPPETHGDDEEANIPAEGVATLLSSISWLLDLPEEQIHHHLTREARDDVRWHHLGTLTSHPWFTRAWVIQEVGQARDPWVMWGNQEFSYRLLMATKRFMVRWAWGPHLRIASLAIHREWEDWSDPNPLGEEGETYTFLDLLDHASLLDCKDPRDKIYAFLGHPLAQRPDGSGPVIVPDYRKSTLEVYREISMHLLQQEGLRVLGSAEHTEETITEPFPSWVVRWNIALVNNNIIQLMPPAPPHPSTKPGSGGIIVDAELLRFMSVPLDRITKSFLIEMDALSQFAQTFFRDSSISWAGPENRGLGLLTYSQMVQYLQRAGTPCAYATPYRPEEREAAFALTLCASTRQDVRAGTAFCAGMRDPESVLGLDDGAAENAPLVEMVTCFQSASYSRSFFLTERGYYGLGPMICRPGDVCAVALGEKVPHVLRPVDDGDHERGLYRYCGEAYVHHMMDGEALEMQRRGVLRPELISLC